MLSSLAAPSVMFHHFCDTVHPRGQGAIDANELGQLIEWLGRDRLLGAHEWLDYVACGKDLSTKFCLTFDDALLCQYEVAQPVLKSFDLTAFYFVYTGYIFDDIPARLENYRYFRTVFFETVDDFYEQFFAICLSQQGEGAATFLENFERDRYPNYPRYYSDNDVRFQQMRDEFLGEQQYFAMMDAMLSERHLNHSDLSQKTMMTKNQMKSLVDSGNVVGLHSHTHPTRLAELPLARQVEEYRRNVDAVTRITGVAPIAISHPCNSYTAEGLDILRELGIYVGFRADINLRNFSNLEFPREDHSTLIRMMRG